MVNPTGDYSVPGFPGQSQTTTDLYYNKYRDYDPTTGRYIQADPIGLAGGASPYSYAMNNPLRYTDPTGKLPIAIPLWPSNAAKRIVKWWSNDDCPDKTPPPPPPVDWCGSTGSEWVPDGNWGNACRKHDDCYARLGASKEMCDIKLSVNMTLECTLRGSNQAMCGIVGGIYGGGLMALGHTPFYHPSRDAFNTAQGKK
jgi:RHS repeat-associated protein